MSPILLEKKKEINFFCRGQQDVKWKMSVLENLKKT